MNVSTITPKKRGRPLLVKLPKPSRGRGRPRKARPRFFITDASLGYIQELSANIAGTLGVSNNSGLATSLALAAVSYGAMVQLRHQAPLKRKGVGNRPNIHLAVLLADCAIIHENITGEDAKSALRKISGRNEDAEKVHDILKYAGAVLSALNVKRGSLRRQARRAINLLE